MLVKEYSIMSELNKNVGENHCARNVNLKTIRNQSDEIKLDFITNILRETGIPANFAPTWKTNNTRKIFFRIKDGCEEKREWVLFENQHFYCAYCLCFALHEYRFVKGVEYVKSGCITDNVNKHEKESYHKKHAMDVF